MSLEIVPKAATDINIKEEFLVIQWRVDTRGPQFYHFFLIGETISLSLFQYVWNVSFFEFHQVMKIQGA
jgi:hypothetical protein